MYSPQLRAAAAQAVFSRKGVYALGDLVYIIQENDGRLTSFRDPDVQQNVFDSGSLLEDDDGESYCEGSLVDTSLAQVKAKPSKYFSLVEGLVLRQLTTKELVAAL